MISLENVDLATQACTELILEYLAQTGPEPEAYKSLHPLINQYQSTLQNAIKGMQFIAWPSLRGCPNIIKVHFCSPMGYGSDSGHELQEVNCLSQGSGSKTAMEENIYNWTLIGHLNDTHGNSIRELLYEVIV